MIKNYKLGKILYKIMKYVEKNSDADLSEVFLHEEKYFSFNLMAKDITFTEISGDNYRNFIQYIDEYLENNFNLPSYKTMYNYGVEVFALLHEIGHIMNMDNPATRILPYEYQEATKKGLIGNKNNSPYENFINYRSFEGEQLADKFAADFINEHYIDLCKIACDIEDDKEAEESLLLWA